MTSFRSTPQPSDEEAASLWAAKLETGPLSATDLRAFETWLAGAPSRRELVADYCEFAADVGRLIPQLAAEDRLPAEPQIPRAARKRSRFTVFAIGGLVAAAASVAVFLAVRPAGDDAAPELIATAASQRHSLTLADGSRIDLSARTRVTIALTAEARRVQLAAGTAYFEVAKNRERPFSVETPAGSVLVTGTKFAVRAEPGAGLEVTVAEGQVRVSATSAEPVSLAAGQRLTASGTTLHVEALSPAAVADSLAWREGKIVFADTPLTEALARFAQYHDSPIAVAPAAAGLRIGGRYSLDDLDGFLAALEEVLPVQVTRPAGQPTQVDLRARN
jgi:transmembrane sensor